MTGAEHFDLPDVSSAAASALTSFETGSATVAGDIGDIVERANNSPAFRPIAALSPRVKRRNEIVPAALIDKSALFRAGLRHILSGSRFRVTADCYKLAELPANALGDSRSVALIGLDRDAEAVLPRIPSLKERHNGLRVVVLSDRLDREQLVAAIEAGADGYLLRDEIEPDAVLKSLELILVDGVVIPQGFAKLLGTSAGIHVASAALPLPARPWEDCPPEPPSLNGVHSPPMAAPPELEPAVSSDLARLSERERLILLHLTQGASNKHIARELNIAEATVKAHVKSLLRKIRVNNRTQAAMWAINNVPAADRMP